MRDERSLTFPSLSPDGTIPREYELDSFLKSFMASSDRVRRFIIAAAITSIVVFISFWNLSGSGWHDARLALVGAGVSQRIADRPANEELKGLQKSFVDEKHFDHDALVVLRDELIKMRAQDLTRVHTPFLGVQFDINDLGAFSAISQSLIALLIALSMARYQENLFICLWKVRKFAEETESFNDPRGHPNMFYHSLAMAQVLSQPPTLARWQYRPLVVHASRSILYMPLAVQALILWHDLRSTGVGNSISPAATSMSLRLQLVFFLIMAVCTFTSLLHSRAGDRRWRHTFFILNPGYKSVRPPSWWEWALLINHLNLSIECAERGGRTILRFGEVRRGKKTRLQTLDLDNFTFAHETTALSREKDLVGPAGERLGFKNRGFGSILVNLDKLPDQPMVGGASSICDGEGNAGGIGLPHAPLVTSSPWSIYFFDGHLLRRIRQGPEKMLVETIGGKPFRCPPRQPFIPRLLSLGAIKSHRLFAADLDHKTVWSIPLQESVEPTHIQAFYCSPRGWAPSRLCVCETPEDQPNRIFLLEERPLNLGGKVLRLIGRYRLVEITDPTRPVLLWPFWK